MTALGASPASSGVSQLVDHRDVAAIATELRALGHEVALDVK